jgi:fumarate reductase flavoprotein subunit
MLVNRDGRRFMDESVAYAVMSGVIKDQRGGECFAVFDHGSFTAPPLDPRFAEAIRAGSWQTSWTAEILAEQLKLGRLFRGDTLEALAAEAGIMPAALCNSVEEYNADCACRADSRFFKPASMLRPVAEPPFYAARMRPTILCLTSTGLRIDRDARVLDMAGRAIPGLFAAGEATGGVMGERYIGSGNSIAHVITYGCIAGRSAAQSGAQ